jgi:hypothetical protein
LRCAAAASLLAGKPLRLLTPAPRLPLQTDLQTDFAAPLDYVEPEPQFKPAAAAPNMGVPRTLPKPTAEGANLHACDAVRAS